MRTVSLLALFALPWLLATPAASQVVISEINFSAQNEDDDQWIEVVNLGAESVELNGWSLYLATDTPGAPGNYWFAIPLTELDSGEFLRVHWMAPIPPAAPPENEIYTGVSIVNFMFGYFAEPLPTVGGALAILSTQDNQLMNNPDVIEDWVSWGDDDPMRAEYPREQLAIQAGKWFEGLPGEAPPTVIAPLSSSSDSLAMNLSLHQDPTPVSVYFRDASPTPNQNNVTGGSATKFGTSCAGTTVIFQSASFPVAGNRDFELRLDNTLGLPNEFAVLVMSLNPGNGAPLLGCPIWVDLAGAVSLLVPTGTGQTFFPFDLSLVRPFLAGAELNLQAAVADFSGPGTIVTTDAIELIFGR